MQNSVWAILLSVVVYSVAFASNAEFSCETAVTAIALASPHSVAKVVTETVLGKPLTYVKIDYEFPNDTRIHTGRFFDDPHSIYFGIDRVGHTYLVSPLGRYDANTAFRVYPFHRRNKILSWGIVFRLRTSAKDFEDMQSAVGSEITVGGYTCADGASRALLQSTGIHINNTWKRALTSKHAIQSILDFGFVRPDGNPIAIETYLINADSFQEILDNTKGGFKRELVDLWEQAGARLSGKRPVKRNHFPQYPQLNPK